MGAQHIPWVYTHSALSLPRQQHLFWYSYHTQRLADVLQWAHGQLGCWGDFHQPRWRKHKLGQNMRSSADTQECRTAEAHELWCNNPVGSLLLNSPLRAPVLHLCHYLLCLLLLAYPILFSQFSSPSHLTVSSCVPLLVPLRSLLSAFSSFSRLETRQCIWFLPDNLIQNSFGHLTSWDVLQGHPEESVSLSFLSVTSTLLVRKHCSAALYLS